jgi:putative serine protease PepD
MSTTPPPYEPGPSTGNPYATPQPAPQQAPQPASQFAPPPAPLGTRPRSRGRASLAAAVLATSLVAGAGAGFGGAALWDETQGGTSSSSTPTATTPVVDQGDTPAAEGSVEAVASAVLPSVVTIRVAGQQGEGSGSGIILSADGTILTNNHVVEVAEGGGDVRVYFEDGTSAPAEILGTDPLTDTAVIKAEGVTDLAPATIGQSANLDVGQDVIAFGAPFGLDSTVTSGIVSALDRPVNVGSDSEGNSTTYPAIQTDAAINPGNSGGPLVDMSGAVVGINSSIRTASQGTGQGGSIGLGFSIPIDEVMPIVDQMIAGETPTHARLGIQVGDAGTAAEGATGALVREVSPGSTAADAGLQQGDVITRVDDRAITDADSLVATIRSYRPGDEVEVAWQRDGEEQSATLELDSDAAAG